MERGIPVKEKGIKVFFSSLHFPFYLIDLGAPMAKFRFLGFASHNMEVSLMG
jgi:hypothetical protein